MPRNRRYRYTIKVLTPLHIGSGDVISGYAYHISDPNSPPYFWTLLDLEAAAAYLLRAGGRTDISVEDVVQFAQEHIDTYGKYSLEISREVARFLQQRNIREQIKLYGKPYLPGSSLKGAIRTAVLSTILAEGKREEFEEAVKKALQDESVTKPHLSDKAEEAVWASDPHHDPLRGLQISDSQEVSPQKYLTISDVRILGFNTRPAPELFWEKLGKREVRDHLSSPRGATRTFLETFQPGTILEGELSFNAFLLEEPWVKSQLEFQQKTDLLSLERISKVCHSKYEALLQQDLALYDALNTSSKGQLTYVIENLTNMQRHDAPETNEFFLQLSWGAGWQAKTVADQTDQRFLYDEVNTAKRFFQDPSDRRYALADFRILTHGQHRLLSPKTRRLVMEGDTPAWPLGWVKVSLHEIDST